MSKQCYCEHGQYIRIGEYSLDEVLPYVVNTSTILKLKKSRVKKGTDAWIEQTEREYDGHMVKMSSQRYQLFASKGVTCVECGLEGKFFGLEKTKHDEGNRYHFNLYGEDEIGCEVLITKDHIQPKSKGGKNTLDNYQVMCFECNVEKADKLPTECECDKRIDLAIKSLELVGHVSEFNPNDCTPLEIENLHYGAKLAMKHLKNNP